MIARPIFEVKNKLTQFLRMIENGETDGVEITRHGKAVAVLGKKTEFRPDEKPDPFMLAYRNFRKNLAAEGGLPDSEWKEYFVIPRAKSKLRHPEDFE